jgi:thiosulfate/3-mercaptopyruvate sulfurtransferase
MLYQISWAGKSVLLVGDWRPRLLIEFRLVFSGLIRKRETFTKSNESPFQNQRMVLNILMLSVLWCAVAYAYQASSIPGSRLISPDELAKLLQSKVEKPLVIQVGSHVLYSQAHIPESEYIGPAGSEEGLQRLRKRLEAEPRNRFIIIYCGCCPWSHCPNVKPADDTLHALGFSNVKVLYIANNFGTDWVDKGYPVAKGD